MVASRYKEKLFDETLKGLSWKFSERQHVDDNGYMVRKIFRDVRLTIIFFKRNSALV